MRSSNNFNVCPRCGTANSLSAKYCYQCGGQLKTPSEPVVCTKCHTVNVGGANFCRICGNDLKVASIQHKECPRCHRIISAESNVCACGYVFANVSQAPLQEKKKGWSLFGNKEKQEKEQPIQNGLIETQEKEKKKGSGRFASFILLLVGLVATVFCFAISSVEFLKQFVFEIAYVNGNWRNLYHTVGAVVKDIMANGVASIAISNWFVFAFAVLTGLSLVFIILGSLIGLIKGSKPKFKGLHLLFTILTAVLAGVGYFMPSLPSVVQGFIFGGVEPQALFRVSAFVVPAVCLIATIFSWTKKEKK
ncbi:MAG: zinc ribbon domain-containing protein [Clostridia bacterium]|nr:zinc ribbon domain-containing protein [Clostridia bacterium]